MYVLKQSCISFCTGQGCGGRVPWFVCRNGLTVEQSGKTISVSVFLPLPRLHSRLDPPVPPSLAMLRDCCLWPRCSREARGVLAADSMGEDRSRCMWATRELWLMIRYVDKDSLEVHINLRSLYILGLYPTAPPCSNTQHLWLIRCSPDIGTARV